MAELVLPSLSSDTADKSCVFAVGVVTLDVVPEQNRTPASWSSLESHLPVGDIINSPGLETHFTADIVQAGLSWQPPTPVPPEMREYQGLLLLPLLLLPGSVTPAPLLSIRRSSSPQPEGPAVLLLPCCSPHSLQHEVVQPLRLRLRVDRGEAAGGLERDLS